MCCAPNVYMFVYTLIGAHMVPLNVTIQMMTEPFTFLTRMVRFRQMLLGK